jgi:cell surface protein SprA
VTADQNLPYTPSGTNNPDNEDLNTDNTINELENYYEYEIDLRPGQLKVGNNYIVDQVTHTEGGEQVNWYLFRIQYGSQIVSREISRASNPSAGYGLTSLTSSSQ